MEKKSAYLKRCNLKLFESISPNVLKFLPVRKSLFAEIKEFFSGY